MKRADLIAAICARFAEAGHPVPVAVEHVQLVRTHAGMWDRMNGAWSWSLFSMKANLMVFGGYEPATACARKSAPGEDPVSRIYDNKNAMTVSLAPPERWKP